MLGTQNLNKIEYFYIFMYIMRHRLTSDTMSDELLTCYTMLKSILQRSSLLSSSRLSATQNATMASLMDYTRRMMYTIEQQPFCGVAVHQINLMYEKPKAREDNDANNNFRESMIAEIHNFPAFYFEHEQYGASWRSLKENIHQTVSRFCPCPFDSYKIERKGGRSYNYDFEATYYKDDALVHSQKMEYKHNTKKLKGMPQFLSLYEKYNLIDVSYTRWFYDEILPHILELDPGFPIRKPDFETYNKHVHIAGHDSHPFFKAMYERLTEEKVELVNQSITTYLELFGRSFNIAKFTEKAKESQVEKKFLMWDLSTFHVEEFNATIFDDLEFKRIKNGNSVVLGNQRAEFHLLLRWRNGKGCNLPAWQIGYFPLT
jgi:hypothetical protein